MSLQFVIGNAGSGKSTYLYQRVIEEAIAHPQKNYLVSIWGYIKGIFTPKA